MRITPRRWYTVTTASVMAPPFALVVVLLVIVQVGFSGYNILLKKFVQGENADPIVFSALRDAFAFPILLAAAVMIEGWHPPCTGSALFMFLILGATGMLGNQLFFILGLYFTSPTTAAMFQPLIPIITATFSMALAIESLPSLTTVHGCLKVGGICMAVAGAMIMTATAAGATVGEGVSMSGIVFLLLNTSCMAFYIVTQKLFLFAEIPASHSFDNGFGKYFWRSVSWMKRQCKDYSTRPINVTAWSYMFGAILIGLCTLVYLPNDLDKFHIPDNTWIPLVYAVLVTSAMNYGIMSWANRFVDPSFVTALWPLQVLLVALLSYVVFGDRPKAWQGVGGILITLGLLCVTWADRQTNKLERASETSPYDRLSVED